MNLPHGENERDVILYTCMVSISVVAIERYVYKQTDNKRFYGKRHCNGIDVD